MPFHRREGLSVNHRHGQRGQALFVFVIALVALIAMTGLILDGGAVFASRGSPRTALTEPLTRHGRHRAQLGSPGLKNGSDVWTAINDTAADNGLESWSAIYTDVYGAPIGARTWSTLALSRRTLGAFGSPAYELRRRRSPECSASTAFRPTPTPR